MAVKPHARFHRKHSGALLQFLKANSNRHKNFHIDRTSTGFPTFEVGNKTVYIREKYVGRGSVNKIAEFQHQVSKSKLFKYIETPLKKESEEDCIKRIEVETNSIVRSLMYKGFFFDPITEPVIKAAVKIDFNTAYWQTCRYFRTIDKSLYRRIINDCVKATRLKITGTLNKKTYRTVYKDGKKGTTFLLEEKKKRIVFQNIYNRIRKFVDELMVWSWMKDPQNFVGFYVDCLYLREYDHELIEKLKEIYDLKINICDIQLVRNLHNKYQIHDINHETGEITPLDAQFKYNEFVNYKFFHKFTPDLKYIRIKTTWQQNTM